VTFFLVFVMCCVWAFANPLFAAPDEPSHVVKASSVVRGVLLPDRVPDSRYQMAPAAMRLESAHASVACTQGHVERDASCIHYYGSDRIIPVQTLVGRYPPTMYAVMGLPTLLSTNAATIYVMRLMFAVLTAVCVALAVANMSAVGGALGRMGVFIALTPMTVFLSGTINPNAAEIAAALLLWSCAIRAVSEANRGTVGRGTIHQLGAAAVFLSVTRLLSPLWTVCIVAVVLVAYATSGTIATLRRQRASRGWLAATVAVSLFQIGWVMLCDPIYGDSRSATNWSLWKAIGESLGRTGPRLEEMVGVFGWTDTKSPMLTFALWGIVVVGAVGWALVAGTRRDRLAFGSLVAVLVVVPTALEVANASDLGLSWYGRYSLPLTVGLPILAVTTIDRRASGHLRHGVIGWTAALLVLAHVAALYFMMRRFAVGSRGPILFFLDAHWAPPVPHLVLLAVFTAATGFLAWVVATPTASPAVEGAGATLRSPRIWRAAAGDATASRQ
jgi:hypothetical protein